MGRIVQAARLERISLRGGVLESTGSSTAIVPVGGDGYQDRVAKYIPGEVLAAYMALDRMLVPDVETFAKQAKTFAEAKLTAVAEQAAAPATGLLSSVAMRHSLYQSLPFAVLLVGLIFTPLYIRQLAIRDGAGSAWRTQAAISSLAFLVWAYAIQGGAFTANNMYQGTFASALLIVFTLASGLFGPAPVNPDAQR